MGSWYVDTEFFFLTCQGTQGETCPIQAYVAWNLCDMPAGIVPVSKVTEADDHELDNLPTNDLV